MKVIAMDTFLLKRESVMHTGCNWQMIGLEDAENVVHIDIDTKSIVVIWQIPSGRLRMVDRPYCL